MNKMENWQVGKIKSTVITDSDDGFPAPGSFGHMDVYHYGGNLVCESILRQKDARLIAAAPKMLAALQNLENDNNTIPDHAWKMVKDAISAAVGSDNFDN